MGILGQSDSDEPATLFFLAVGAAIASIVICVQKEKPEMAILAILFFPVGIVGVLRVVKPKSSWARRYYPPGSEKARLAHERFRQALLE